MWYFDVRKDHPLTKNDIYRINVREKFWSGPARLMRIHLLIALLFAGVLHAQVPGSVLDPAVPAINPLNPNGDGFITSSAAAFSGPSDEAEFELAFLPVQQYQAEPAADNQFAAGCQFYELVHDPATNADAAYFLYSNPDGIPDNGDELMLFRFRVARYSNGVTAFSFLIDTDYRFGFSGPEADPNAVTGNPGFEKEVAVFNNTGTTGGVRVFDVDGTSAATIVNFQAPITSHYQVSYALNQSAGCSAYTPVFVDMYVPFSALGIPSTRQLRMAVAVNEDIASSLGGGASDIGGVDGNLLPDDDDQFVAAMKAFSPVGISNPANKAPITTDASSRIDENSAAGTVVQTVSAADINGDVLTYSIVSGNSSNAFTIDPVSGVIRVNNQILDFESTASFTLLVRVSDGLLYDNAVITILLNDVNEPPAISDADVSVDEHSIEGTVVHASQATDPDANTSLEYSIISGNEQGLLDIFPGDGRIVVRNPGALDFETAEGEFILEVRVSDGAFSDTALITIRINDVNEPPVLTGASVSTDENNTSGTWISAVQATDPDAGAVLTYSIIAGNTGSAFVIDNVTGTVTVNNAAALDFESTPTFSLVIRATDGALSSEAVIQVDIRNVNEAPTVQDASPSVEFEVAKNGIAYSVVATDPDAGDVLVFALEQDNPESIFSIDPTTGDITVRDRRQLLTGSFSTSVVVRATDSGGLSDTGAINITIMPRLDRSAIAPLKGFSPNGDGQNDFWLINGIEAFPDNFIQVFNRWGILVYEASGYDNDQQAWDGAVRNTRTTEESIYFYIINAADFTPITGYVIVKP